MPVRTKVLCSSVKTNENDGEFSIQIPGTFLGKDPYAPIAANGRFVKLIKIWTDTFLPEAKIYNMRVEDEFSILVGNGKLFPSVAIAKMVYPEYPVIMKFDDDIIESDTIKKGLFFGLSQTIEIQPFEVSVERYHFIPSGLFLKTMVTSGDGSGQVFKMNVFLGKNELE